MKPAARPTNLEFLAAQFGEDQWREVIRLFLATTTAARFDAFMEAVVRHGRLAGRSDFTSLCLREAKQPGEAAFLAALQDPKQRYPALQALEVLLDLNETTVRRVAGEIVANPAAYFGGDEIEPAARDLLLRIWQQTPSGATDDEPSVFLSYSFRDRDVAMRIGQRIERAGLRVWYDAGALQGGDAIISRIEKGIEGCRFFVPLVGPTSVSSRWVDAERTLVWHREIEDGRLKVIPVLLAGDPRRLPLRYRNESFVDLRGDFEAGLERLLSQLTSPPSLPLRRTNHDGTELVLVSAGACRVGDRGERNNPPRRIELPDFYLAITPVTNRQYATFIAGTDHPPPEEWENERFNQPEQPVVGVSWHDAKTYCDWAGLRLPDEWEWEKGARGTDGRRYPWGNEEPTAELANFDSKVGQTTPVGSFPKGASPYGLLDMAGNVWEWTGSWYDDDKDTRSVRGGSFINGARDLRAAIRVRDHPGVRGHGVGFRCARDP